MLSPVSHIICYRIDMKLQFYLGFKSSFIIKFNAIHFLHLISKMHVFVCVLIFLIVNTIIIKQEPFALTIVSFIIILMQR